MVAPSRAGRTTRSHKKRHGKHQKHTKKFLEVYWPYVPLLLVIVAGIIFSNLWQPRRGVLAYATSMSRGGLLSATNQQRANNGAAALSENSKLNSAAQAKANDMVAKNYWSHNTPGGDPPWVFIDAAGYDYTKAGENLAYGFATSADTVTGWMNSPSHKANLLDTAFTEVGFGFANSSNYVGTGQQTIVVAMYGKPAAASPTPAPATSSPSQSSTQAPQTKAAEASVPASSVPTAAKKKTTTKKVKTQSKKETTTKEEPVTTDTPETLDTSQPQTVSRLSVITGGALPWVTSATIAAGIAAAAFFFIRHSWTLRRWIHRGERYVLHHVAFDLAIISMIGLCFIATRGAGFVL